MKLDPEKSALLIVDVQNDFCPGGALAVPDGDAVIEPINRIAGRFRHIVATQDWHPARHVSFASRWEGRQLYDTVEAQGIPQVLWPDHCVQGTKGAEFRDALDIHNASLILRKGTRSDLDSYSALFENDRSTHTGLDGWLRCLGIGRLFLCGLATDYCVYYTALDALRLGYEVVVVSDAVMGVGVPPGSIARSIDGMKARGVLFVDSSEIG